MPRVFVLAGLALYVVVVSSAAIPLTSIEFQVKLEENRFSSAEPGTQAFMSFLSDIENAKPFSFPFKVKKSSGVAGLRTEDYWDTLLGEIAQKTCKIRHRGYLLGGDVGNGEIIFKCKGHVKEIVASVPTDAASKYGKNATTKVEQNLYLNMIDNNVFQRSTKVTGLPGAITPAKVSDLEEYFPDFGKFFDLDKSEPLYAAHQVCYYLWEDIKMTIDGEDAEGMLQIKYASQSDCKAHNVIPVEAEFAWKIERKTGDDWDLDLIENSEEILEYLSNSAWRHHQDVM